ncbi:uncharacterized protein LOC119711495 isoform X2 [Motacilla alba alba]|uniref:uncharacterized protein LOC119711495 isoform X2 n=1 Tax=Motacilla alba alba TaxID=1094192 RepID=UPI0018D5054E|nr:uncharacterized protein LOC119711495 isoform X2 [Motacilla alba alba]
MPPRIHSAHWDPLHSASIPLFPFLCQPSLLGPQSLLCPPAGVPPSAVSLWAQPPGGQVALGDRLVLSCTVAAGTGPLSFFWHQDGSMAQLSTGPHLELSHVGNNDSGQYRCRVSEGDSVAESDPLNVTVLDSRKHQERPPPQIPWPPKRRDRCCTPTSWSPRGQGRPPVPPPSRIPR